jgi:proline dehydrogenase
LQSYLRRSEKDLDRVIAAGGHVRICKGAYAEDSHSAYQNKSDVNAAFDRMTRVAMDCREIYPAIATHDEARIRLALDEAEWRKGPWEFQLLYGVRTKLQARLLADGFPVRIYVPYGAAWYPYLTRRIAERPANLWFFVRAVFGRG